MENMLIYFNFNEGTATLVESENDKIEQVILRDLTFTDDLMKISLNMKVLQKR